MYTFLGFVSILFFPKDRHVFLWLALCNYFIVGSLLTPPCLSAHGFASVLLNNCLPGLIHSVGPKLMTTKPVCASLVELESSPEVPEKDGISRSFSTSLLSGCRFINLLGCCLRPTMFHAIVTCLLTWVEGSSPIPLQVWAKFPALYSIRNPPPTSSAPSPFSLLADDQMESHQGYLWNVQWRRCLGNTCLPIEETIIWISAIQGQRQETITQVGWIQGLKANMENEPDQENLEENPCARTAEEELKKSLNLEASFPKFSCIDMDKELELKNDLVKV